MGRPLDVSNMFLSAVPQLFTLCVFVSLSLAWADEVLSALSSPLTLSALEGLLVRDKLFLLQIRLTLSLLQSSGSRFSDRSNAFASAVYAHIEALLADATSLKLRADRCLYRPLLAFLAAKPMSLPSCRLIQSCNVAAGQCVVQLSKLSGNSCWWDHDPAFPQLAWVRFSANFK